MTRRQLARRVSSNLIQRGNHYGQGTTVYKTLDGDWGAFAGLQRPPDNAAWYEHVGWDKVSERNTVLKVETYLRRLEKKFDGYSKRVERKTLVAR